jgi:hypothetical protein
VRRLNRSAITAVVLAPPLASLVFAVVWISVFVVKQKHSASDAAQSASAIQVIIATAFTVASYLVTAGMSFSQPKLLLRVTKRTHDLTGALIIALVAYLENSSGANGSRSNLNP